MAAVLLGLAAAPGAGAGERTIVAASVIAVLTADWTGDGGIDRALLVDNGGGYADLLIFSDLDSRMELAAESRSVAWLGHAWGTLPELGLSSTGALQVTAMNEAVGRHRWRETLTIVYRNQQFLVGGYTYSSYDTLDPDSWRDCDVNLITGQGIANGSSVKSPIRAMPIEKWSAEMAASSGICPNG
jgi:hypothetical protein